jgi:hypothetical protein
LNRDGPSGRDRGNAIAASVPGKVVCFLRWGPDPWEPTGNGNAYPPPGANPAPRNVGDVAQDYVSLPDKAGPGLSFLSLGDGDFMAHEIGHYLGLYHTFPGWSDLFGPVWNGTTPASAGAASATLVAYVAANGGTVDALDGDGLSDTPPDPSGVLYTAFGQDTCARPAITVSGTIGGQAVTFTFQPNPNNVMSYYAGCGWTADGTPRRFSPQQIARMNGILQHPARRHLVEQPSFPDFHNLPAASFQHAFDYWVHRGLWPATLTFSAPGGTLLAGGSFQRRPGRRVRHLMTSQDLQAEIDLQRTRGARPEQIQVVDGGAGRRYTAIWGPARGEWIADLELDPATFNTRWQQRRGQGWIQVDVCVADGPGGVFTGVWERRPFDDYALFFGMTVSDYAQRRAQLGAQGLRTVRFCRYRDGGAERLTALWERLPGRFEHDFNLDGAAYQATYNQRAGQQGLRLLHLNAHEDRFSAVWHVAGIGRSLGYAPASGPGASVRASGEMDLVLVGPAGDVQHVRWDGSPWPDPTSLGGVVTSDPAAVSPAPGRVDVLARGTDNGLWRRRLDGGVWSDWTPIGGGAVGSGPALSSAATGRVDLFVQGSGGDLLHRVEQGGAWGSWESLGGVLASRPAACSWAPGRLDVFVRGTDDALWHRWFDAGAWQGGWESLGGALRSAPAACSWGQGRIDVFVRGIDDTLQHSWFDGAWRGWESLGGVVTSDPAAVSRGPNRIDVLARGTDGGLWMRSWDGTAWRP